MKKVAFAALAATAAIVATPAMAQSANASGTVQVTGSVAGKCTAQAPISGTITLGELALSTGLVDSAFSSNTGGLSRSFTVKCTSANVQIAVSSDALNNTTDATTGNGYTGRVHYTSTLTAAKAAGGNATATYTTLDTLPAASTATLGDRLANSTNNVTVAVSAGSTTGASDLLKSGTYNSTISITVSPV